MRIQLIERAEAFDARIELGHFRAISKPGRSGVAGFCRNVIQVDHMIAVLFPYSEFSTALYSENSEEEPQTLTDLAAQASVGKVKQRQQLGKFEVFLLTADDNQFIASANDFEIFRSYRFLQCLDKIL